MEEHLVKIRSIALITHDVLQIVTDKPEDYHFVPGQATEISIPKIGWMTETRPFTFTSLPGDDYLQFTIKTYPERKGVTNQLLLLKENDELMLHEIFGAISYRGEGLFIAGGAGITPFISIFRDLNSKKMTGGNKLIFANRKKEDIILRNEFYYMLDANLINVLSEEKTEEYVYGFISEKLLNEHIRRGNQYVYLCGPPPMMEAVGEILTELNVDENFIVKEAV